MMTQELQKPDNLYSVMESVIADGDLAKLSPKQRVEYYHKTCESLGLNPLTRPFEYQRFNGKVVLYARREATEQLRFIHKVSIYRMEKETFNDVFVVTAYAKTADGKEDVSTGAVSIAGLKGEALSNAFMKAETKAKRRVTLSICGLGVTDQSEVDSIPNSQAVQVNHETGEIVDVKPVLLPPDKAELIMAISGSATLEDLKKAFHAAYMAHIKNPDILVRITDIKNKRKDELEAAERQSIEQFRREAAEFTGFEKR